MAINFDEFFNSGIKWAQFAAPYNFKDMRKATHQLYDEFRAVLDNATDPEITFIPSDPDADDPGAPTEAERYAGWSLGHLVAHVTATNEETFLFASLLARGIPQDGRIRTEIPWREVDTVEKAIQRLEESRRIVLAYMDAMPDEPRLDVLRTYSERAYAKFGDINAKASVMMGLTHHYGHMAQIHNTKRQAQEALYAHA